MLKRSQLIQINNAIGLAFLAFQREHPEYQDENSRAGRLYKEMDGHIKKARAIMLDDVGDDNVVKMVEEVAHNTLNEDIEFLEVAEALDIHEDELEKAKDFINKRMDK